MTHELLVDGQRSLYQTSVEYVDVEEDAIGDEIGQMNMAAQIDYGLQNQDVDHSKGLHNGLQNRQVMAVDDIAEEVDAAGEYVQVFEGQGSHVVDFENTSIQHENENVKMGQDGLASRILPVNVE